MGWSLGDIQGALCVQVLLEYIKVWDLGELYKHSPAAKSYVKTWIECHATNSY